MDGYQSNSNQRLQAAGFLFMQVSAGLLRLCNNLSVTAVSYSCT